MPLLVMVMLLMLMLCFNRVNHLQLPRQAYHVFELEIELPKYAMYAAEERALPAGPPASHVSFVMQHPATRVASWIESRFNTKPNVGSGATSLDAAFTCMRTRQPLVVRAATTGSGGLRVWLHCESMELAGELLQVSQEGFDACQLRGRRQMPCRVPVSLAGELLQETRGQQGLSLHAGCDAGVMCPFPLLAEFTCTGMLLGPRPWPVAAAHCCGMVQQQTVQS